MASQKLGSAGVKIIIRKDHVDKEGNSAVYLQVVISRKRKVINTGIKWPPSKFKNSKLIARSKNDQDVQDFNLVLQDLQHKAFDIIKTYRLQNKPLDLENFVYDFKTNFSSDDFLKYMERRIKERYDKNLITPGTERMQKVVLRRLERFQKPLNFNMLNHRTAEDFEAFMKKEGVNSVNTRWGNHKVFKTYLNEARKDGHEFTYPYQDFSPKQTESKFEALTSAELSSLWNLYLSNKCTGTIQKVLARFLFMCFTGLRISDTIRFKPEFIKDNFIVLEMHKTRAQQKLVKVPLSSKAAFLIEQAKKENPLKPFASPTEIYSNRILKDLAIQLKIRKRLHHHMARESFATLFMENGGSLEVLQQYLGHHDIKMVMKYVKVSDQRKMKDSTRIDSFIK